MKGFCAAALWTALTLVGCAVDELEPAATTHRPPPIVAGAGYTSFDVVAGGCQNAASSRGTCNAYAANDRVFMVGGPNDPTTGLADGSYFFAVLAPGSQLAGFLDATAGDASGADPVSNRTFAVADHEIVAYGGTRPIGETPDGRFAIGVAPFDDTDHAGGVYILAICAVEATDPSQCKYDAFRVRAGDSDVAPPPSPAAHGGAYYDANLDGLWTDGEPGLASWTIDYHDMISATVETGADGTFALELIPDGYLFVARQATNVEWFQTAGAADQLAVTRGAAASANRDMTYWIEVADDEVVRGLYFGHVCIGPAGARSAELWARTHALTRADALSLQVSTAALNVRHGFVRASAMIYAPGTTSASALGFASISDVIVEASKSLGVYGVVLADSPERAHQRALEAALESANNDRSFVQPTPLTCPLATF